MAEEHKVSVLMPTYNDSKYLAAAIQSVLIQSHKNWELLIIDDGSEDNTPQIVKQFEDYRIKYIREGKNSGQLNALMKGTEFIQGDYVTIFHSDDEFSDDKSFERNVSVLSRSNCDGLFSDHITMDTRGEVYGRLRAAKSIGPSSPATIFLRGGSNIITDAFWVKRNAFDNVLSSYIIWNMAYWLRFDRTNVSTLSLKKVEPWYKYRLYPENYIQSDIGKFEAVNGCLRTIVEIGKRIDLPFLRLQRLLARVLKARMKPLYKNGPCSSRHLREMIEYVLHSRFRKVPDNIYFKGLLGFYSNLLSDRSVEMHFEKEEQTFLGKDSRIFFKLMEKKKLPTVYEYILKEAIKGFGTVVVKRRDYEKARNVMEFLNLLVKEKRWRIND